MTTIVDIRRQKVNIVPLYTVRENNQKDAHFFFNLFQLNCPVHVPNK